MRKKHSNWREDLREVADIPSSEPETETKSERKVEDKKVNNKIVINPVMKEAFGEIGGVVLEVTEEAVVQELTKEEIEELQRKKNTQEGREPGRQKVEEDDKWIQKATKNMRKDKPCTGDKFGSESCPPGSKRYNLAKTFKKMAKEEVVRENNNSATGTQLADVDRRIAMQKLKRAQLERKAAKEVTKPKVNDDVYEGLSVEDQMRVSREYFKNRKPQSPEAKKKEDRIKAKNYADNQKNSDPYKSRAGESD